MTVSDFQQDPGGVKVPHGTSHIHRGAGARSPSVDSRHSDHIEPTANHQGISSPRPQDEDHHEVVYAAGSEIGRVGTVVSVGGVSVNALKEPWGLKWRNSSWFITLVVFFGICSDILAYTIIVPVLPFRLEKLHYNNIAAHMSWLLFAYSGGVFVATFPIAYYFHRYPYRRLPLVVAVLVMEASFILFIFAKPYWCMVLSRTIQGVCSTVVWTVGLALITENVDPAHMGVHLGIAFTGVGVGAAIAPPIGGALYQHMGWGAPFVFCIIFCGVDLVARLFIIEKRDLLKYYKRQAEQELKQQGKEHLATSLASAAVARNHPDLPVLDVEKEALAALEGQTVAQTPEKPKELSPIGVLVALASLPRGITAFTTLFVFGFAIGVFDATIAVHVYSVWGKDANFIGIIFLCAAIPELFVGPLMGWIADKHGAEWVAVPCVLLTLPFIGLIVPTWNLAAFVVFFAAMHCMGGALNTLGGIEMALVAQHREGISEIHQFAALNIAFAISSAVGAIAGGQMYDHLPQGWAALCWLNFGLFAVAVIPLGIYVGNWPLLWRILRRGPPKGFHHTGTDIGPHRAPGSDKPGESTATTTQTDDTAEGQAPQTLSRVHDNETHIQAESSVPKLDEK